jgi:hypothetical protein
VRILILVNATVRGAEIAACRGDAGVSQPRVCRSGHEALEDKHKHQQARDQSAGEAVLPGCEPVHAAKGTSDLWRVKGGELEPERKSDAVARAAQGGSNIGGGT